MDFICFFTFPMVQKENNAKYVKKLLVHDAMEEADSLHQISKMAGKHKDLAKILASSENSVHTSVSQVSEKLDDVKLLNPWKNDTAKRKDTWRDYDFGPLILTVGELHDMMTYVEDIKNTYDKNKIDDNRVKMFTHWDTLRFVKLLELLGMKKIENLFEKVDRVYDSQKKYEYLGWGEGYQHGIQKIKKDLKHRFNHLVFLYTEDYDLKDPTVESTIKHINFIVSGNYFKDAVYESPEKWQEWLKKPGSFCKGYTKKIETAYPSIYEELSKKLWMPLGDISEYISNMYQKEYIDVKDWDRVNLKIKALKYLDKEILYLWKYLIQDSYPNYLQSLRNLKDLVTWAWILDLKPIMADDEVELYSKSGVDKIPPTN